MKKHIISYFLSILASFSLLTAMNTSDQELEVLLRNEIDCGACAIAYKSTKIATEQQAATNKISEIVGTISTLYQKSSPETQRRYDFIIEMAKQARNHSDPFTCDGEWNALKFLRNELSEIA